jgi:hypothetical protein
VIVCVDLLFGLRDEMVKSLGATGGSAGRGDFFFLNVFVNSFIKG